MEMSAVDMLEEAIRDFTLSQRDRARASLEPWMIKVDCYQYDNGQNMDGNGPTKTRFTWLTR